MYTAKATKRSRGTIINTIIVIALDTFCDGLKDTATLSIKDITVKTAMDITAKSDNQAC